MKRSFWACWPAIAAAIGIVSPQPSQAAAHWSSFEGKTFQVEYPAVWSRIGLLDGRTLDILSPGQREEGAVIGKGQAEIVVQPLDPKAPMGSQISQWLKGADVVVRRGKASGLHSPSCSSFETVTQDNNAADGGHPTFDRTSAFFCSGAERPLLLTVRYWRDDPKAVQHEAVARRMAASLRSR